MQNSKKIWLTYAEYTQYIISKHDGIKLPTTVNEKWRSTVTDEPVQWCCVVDRLDQCDKLTVDNRTYFQLIWPTTVQFIMLSSSTSVKLRWQRVSMTDMPWQNFLSPEFRTSSRGKYPYLYRYPNFFKTQCRTGCLQCFDAVGWAAGRASGL